MAELTSITAASRTVQGTRASQRLRSEGQVPGILYGHGQDPEMLSVSAIELASFLRHGGHGMLEVKIDGRPESAFIKDVQWDTFGIELIHVDFARVSIGERVTVEIQLILKGTPKGVADGGVVNFAMHSLEVECPAESIIEQLPINIAGLELNKSILVKDIVLPEGMKVLDDPEQVVVSLAIPAVETEEDGLTSTAEPEVIRRESAEGKTADE